LVTEEIVLRNDILNITNLHSGYKKLKILQGINFSAHRGDIVAIMGPNGAGKSTLLRTIFGMCNIMDGTIQYLDEDLRGLKPQQILTRGVSYVPQGRCNFPLMTVQENLEMAAYLQRDKEQIRKERQYIYELFPILSERRRQLASNLSGGEQQVLELGMALLRQPKLLLIDEPSMGLAPQIVNWVFREIQRLQKTDVTVLLVEQNVRKVMEIAERTVVMRLGQIIWDGSTRGITLEDLAEMFLTGKASTGG
jgi:branched-chain amino acid transport system ATP-binding protein